GAECDRRSWNALGLAGSSVPVACSAPGRVDGSFGSAGLRSGVLLALGFLALALHARLLVVLAPASLGEDAALLDLLVEAAQGAFERLVLTHSDFCQSRFTSPGQGSRMYCVVLAASWLDASPTGSSRTRDQFD